MSPVPPDQVSFRPENNTFYIVRQIIALVSFCIHFSLFSDVETPLFWTLLLSYTLLYPLIIRFTPFIKDNAQRNMLIDSSVDGIFLGLWGFNPFLCAIYISCITIINMTAGSISFGLKGLSLIIIFSLFSAYFAGMYFRPELPINTLIISTIGLAIFITIVGLKIYRINTRLRQTRTSLQQQKEELIRLNRLANVVNTHLSVKVIMESVMHSLEEIYPFEAMYILSLKSQHNRIEVSGIYGSTISQAEHAQFQDLTFGIEADKHSMFVHSLTKKKVIHIGEITSESVAQGAKIDQKLFAIKPSLSVACFPIFIDDKVVGGACFINYINHFLLSKPDIHKIQEYLVQVGTAVRNTSQMDELTKAKELAVKAQSKAEASEEAKSRFLANMSHEIRTPLTAIMGYSEALQEEGITDGDHDKFVGHILRSSDHLLSMINDILDISKIEASKIEVEKIDFNILELLFDIESYLLIKTKEKNLGFSLKLEYPIPKIINTDPTRLKQILLNLCNNAIKFTSEGTISLGITAHENETLEFRVSDTGIGMSRSVQKRIFSAFDQADTSTTRLFGGTGLGLYISQNLAKLLGGSIAVESTEGIGSTFILSTGSVATSKSTQDPIINYDQFLEKINLIKERKDQSAIPNLSGRALLAEDNLENQELISRLVHQTKMQVDVVGNGLKAVEAAGTNEYSIILLDMQMPVMGGREAAKLIQASGNETPIVAFTANVMKHQIDEYKSLGFSDVLEKPIVKEKLFNTLKFIAKRTQKAPPRFLVVEDNEVNQLILVRHIKKNDEHSEVMIANNGLEALELVKTYQFNLILMDMEMPLMNGLDATKGIREMGCDTPIYMVSGNIDQKSVEKCFAYGATGHLHKPLDKYKILDVIESATLT